VALTLEVLDSLPGEAPDAASPTADRADPLSPRELEALRLVAAGLSNGTIAARLYVSERTVRYHLTSLFNKLGVTSRTEAVAIASRRGLL
jgi:DNA-binding NarL/FixJ family response regulator